MPLHPQIVHIPIALAVILPMLSLGVILAWARGVFPRSVFVIVVVLQAVLAGGAIAASRTGEAEEHEVEEIVGHDAIEHHEEAGNLLVISSIVLLLLGIPVLRIADERRARLLASVVTVGMCVSAWFAYEAGHHGGELVYELGAAEAYTPDSPR